MNEIEIITCKDHEYKTQVECKSCGRFIGIYELCPYCLANNNKRLSIKILKVFSILTSVVGLLILLFIAQNIKTPLVRIEDLTPLSNFAHVRIEGKVEKSFGYHPEWKSISFTIAQPSYKNKEEVQFIRVNAYSKVAQKIKELNLIPIEGDVVSVEGTVRYQKDNPTLIINSAEHLLILKKYEAKASNAQEVNVAEINENYLNKPIKSKASINKVLNFDKGKLILISENQNLPIWIPKHIVEKIEYSFEPNDKIEFVGVIKYYNNKLEIVINNEKEIKKINEN